MRVLCKTREVTCFAAPHALQGSLSFRNQKLRHNHLPIRMKQTRHNQKIINWHRSLKPNALSSSYLRLKETQQDNSGEILTNQSKRSHWCCLNCEILRRLDSSAAIFISNVCEHQQDQVFRFREMDEERWRASRKVVGLFNNPFVSDLDSEWNNWLMSAKRCFQNAIPLPSCLTDLATQELSALNAPHQTRVLEEQLAHSVRFLMDPFGSDGWQYHAVPVDAVEKIKRALGFEALQRNERERAEQAENCIQFLALFSGYAIRRIEDWSASSERLEEEVPKLARHLFCQYAVPSWLEVIWGFQRHFSFFQIQHLLMWAGWFICIGRGGSLSKLARQVGFVFTEKMLPYLFAAPADLCPEYAGLWALVMGHCGNERVAHWVANTEEAKVRVNDVHTRADGQAFLQMWEHTMKWVAKYESCLTDDEGLQILDWAFAQYELKAKNHQLFSWSGRTVQSVLSKARMFFQKRQKMAERWKILFWEAGRFAWSCTEENHEAGNAVRWDFVELNDSFLVWEEGHAMRHCAASEEYKELCETGNICLISLTKNGLRAVTIELSGHSLCIRQVKGRFNREALEEELRVIELWKVAVLAP